MEMLPVKTLDDINTLDRMVQELTSKLSYPMGSILKIAARYLPNYGIEISDENRGELERLSLTNYFSCWGRAAKVTLEAIKKATRDAGFPVDNSDLNDEVGKMTVDVLINMARADKTKQFLLTDIGAGDGETTGAVFDAICNEEAFELAERCEFMLIEPSEENLWNAVNNLREHRINTEHKVNITTVGGTNHNFLRRLRSEESDIVYSSAVFHHMIFPTYLDTLREGLASDGVLVIGDWYTTIFKHPAFVAEILKNLDIDKMGYAQFQSLFNCSDGDEKELCRQMDRDEIITNFRMLRYIVAIGQEFLKIPVENRDEFLEGHCAFEDRKADLESKGFVTDLKALTEHPGFLGMQSNVRNVDPYGAAKVGAFAKSFPPPKVMEGAPAKERPRLTA
ncbi:MAG: class I SAM-dependent methyltransferase [Candidatus Micrarchaeota archaeon]